MLRQKGFFFCLFVCFGGLCETRYVIQYGHNFLKCVCVLLCFFRKFPEKKGSFILLYRTDFPKFPEIRKIPEKSHL